MRAVPDTPRLHVGYVLKTYPRLSETFILDEILGLEARGVQVTILALKRPGDPRFHAKIARVAGDVLYAPDVRSNAMLGFLAAHAPALSGRESVVSEMFWSALHHRDIDSLKVLVPAIAFVRAIRERGIQHLHAHFATSATSTAMRLARIAGIGYSFTAHAKDIFHDDVDDAALAEKVAYAQHVVAVSDVSAAHLRELAGPAHAQKIVRVYNGLDLTEYPSPVPSASARVPLVAGVGRLIPKKGFDTLIDAIALLRREGRSVPCEIIGDGELRDALSARVASQDVGDLVTLRGAARHDDVCALLARARVFALPACIAEDGNRDGLPVAIVEAMACGTPVVSTPVVGIPEAVRHEETGVLVPERDAPALARAIVRLLDDRAFAARLAAAARAHVEAQFDVRHSAAIVQDLFARAVLPAPSPSPVSAHA